MATNIGPKIGIDGEKQFRSELTSIGQQLRTLGTEMKAVTSSFDANDSSQKKLAAQSDVLTRRLSLQEQQLAGIQKGLDYAKANYAENSDEVQKWQQALNNATTDLNKTKAGIKSLSDEAKNTGPLSDFGKTLKSGLATAAKAAAAATAAAAGAMAALVKSAVENYGEYEQLVGGVETLFKSSADTVQEYANNAYKTAGLSANEYMETVTGFSASLLQSMGNDTQAAAEKANRAITDMSDNANKMGTDMTSIQNAYQGFAKANYTMLDNLKLGYGGTKEEMQRLLADAEKISGVKYDLSSYADIVDAIHVVQTEMGITGTTATEAATTIQGSANAMKSAWSNLITGMSNENLDLDKLVQNVIDSVNTFADNLIPRLQIMLPRFVQGLTQLISGMIPYVAPALELLLPPLIEGVGGLVSGIVQALPAAVEAITAVIPMLVEQLTILLPQIISAGVEIIAALASGIGENLPALIPAVVDAIITITEGLLDHIDLLIIAAGQLIAGLAQGLIEAIPRLIGRLPEIIGAIVKGLLKGLAAIGEVGSQLVHGLFNGISNAAAWLYEKVKGWASSVVGWIKDFFGIHSPSKVFADEVGKFIPPGITLGVEQAMPRAMRDMGAQLSALSAIPMPGSTTTNLGGVNIVVYGAQGQDVSELADIVMARMQSAVERREAVFA